MSRVRRQACSDMLNQELLKAIKSENKVLRQEQSFDIEKDFIVNNWQFFAETKGAVKGALFQYAPQTGTELLQVLGLPQAVIHKVKKEELVKAVMEMETSEVFKLFLQDVQDHGECVSYFVVSKRAIIMSNAMPLVVPGKFIHKFQSQGKLNDIYWQWADNMKGKLRLY